MGISQPKTINQKDQTFFKDNGYLLCRDLVPKSEVATLRAAIDKLIEKSRKIEKSDGVYDLDEDHTAANPKLRRIAYLDDLDPVFWEFASDSKVADLAADLFGADVSFRECIINFKWAKGGQLVKWHQDIPFYPHTNLDVAQFLVFLDDVGSEQGPIQVIPKSHQGPVYNHYDADDNWLGYIPADELKRVSLDSAVELTGGAGSVTAHHCVTVHGSKPNLSPKGRPTLILGYNAADARPYTAAAYPSSHADSIVRGSPATCARHDPVSLRLPPDWSEGYTSIFAHQNQQES